MTKNKDLLKQIGAMVVFGTIGMVRRHISLGSGLIAMVRGAVGALFLLIVSAAFRRKIDIRGIRQNLPLLVMSGILLGANWVCLFEAYNHTSISVATMCYYMAPVIVLAVSAFALRERMTPLQYGLAFVSLVGMVMVSGVLTDGGADAKGVMFGLLAAVLYSGIILVNKRVGNVDPVDKTLVQLAVSAIAILPYVMFVEGIPSVTISLGTVCLLIVAGIVHTGVAYLMYFGSMSNLKSNTIAILSYIDPVTAVLVSTIILQEHLTWMTGIGVVLVIGATAAIELVAPKNLTKNVAQ